MASFRNTTKRELTASERESLVDMGLEGIVHQITRLVDNLEKPVGYRWDYCYADYHRVTTIEELIGKTRQLADQFAPRRSDSADPFCTNF
jgi:hypothetical protein